MDSVEREEAIFTGALDKPSRAERAAFLDGACGDDGALRTRVEALLATHYASGGVLDFPPEGISATEAYRPIVESEGTIIGPYKLLQKIGEGGFGVVYMARQEKPVSRDVALKIIKPGMDTDQVIARFESERQALALMDHPNIAKVLDAGATASGRPFFVMELVKGVPITEFCDQNHLSPEGRLKLFIAVCHAIQHAHHKSVIHRDIKPNNVMVTLHDGEPVVKVIDFGVAKATAQRLTEKTLFTAYGQMIGTPAYMSPEQAEMSGLDIDTRSDVYSLGVLLYELLTGTTPLESKRLREAGYAEMQRMIREQEAPRPSNRISSLRESATVLAGNRGLDVKHLTQILAGDLDWVVMKALEKDRNRRYDTPGVFAEDIQRYLRREPIVARPPSTTYKFKKFVQRNLGPIAIGLITFTLAIVCLFGGLTIGLIHTSTERDRAVAAAAAEQKQREHAELNERRAKEAEDRAKAVSRFLQRDLLGMADTMNQANRRDEVNPDLTVRQALDRASAHIDRGLAGHQLVEAEMRQTIGDAYNGIGDARRGVQHLQRCLDIRLEKLGPNDIATMTAMDSLGRAMLFADQVAESEKVFAELNRRANAVLGKDHELSIASLNHWAHSLLDLGQLDRALPMLEESLRQSRKILGPDHHATLSAVNGLAIAYERAGRLQDALALHDEALRWRRDKLGPSHTYTQTSMNNLGKIYWRLGRLDRSIPLFEEAYRLRKSSLGESHPLTIRTQANLGINLHDAGRIREAIPILTEALPRARKSKAIEKAFIFTISERLAECHTDIGEHAKAEPLFREQWASTQRMFGPTDTKTVGWQARLGLNLLCQNKFAEAEPLLRTALAFRENSEPEDWRTFNTRSLLGGALLGQKKYAEAEPLLLTGYAGMKQRMSDIPANGKQRVTESLERLVQLYQATGKNTEATKWQKERDDWNSKRKAVVMPSTERK